MMEQSLGEQLSSMMQSVSKNVGLYDLTPQPLHSGRSSELFHITNRKDSQSHALKVIYRRLARRSEEAVRAAYQRERNIHQSLKNRHILQLENAFADENNYYLVLQYCPTTLRTLSTPLPPSTIRQVGLQIAKALSYLHKKRIAHGDLKPEHVLFTKEGEVKLCDFGEALRVEEGKGESMRGELLYAPPEAIERGDEQRDVWALACMLYEMSMGRPPFEIKSWKELATTLTHQYLANYPYPEQLHPSLIHLLKGIFLRDQTKRLKIEEVIAHPFFTNQPLPKTPSLEKVQPLKKSASLSRKKDTYRSLELRETAKQNNKNSSNMPINQPDYKKLLQKKFKDEKAKATTSKPSSSSKNSRHHQQTQAKTSPIEPRKALSPLRTEGMVIKEVDKKKSKIIIDKNGFTRRGESDQMNISCDGKAIRLRKEGNEKVYALQALPQKYFGKYQEAKMIVREAMSCTPKITYMDQQLTLSIMFDGTVHASFQDGWEVKGVGVDKMLKGSEGLGMQGERAGVVRRAVQGVLSISRR